METLRRLLLIRKVAISTIRKPNACVGANTEVYVAGVDSGSQDDVAALLVSSLRVLSPSTRPIALVRGRALHSVTVPASEPTGATFLGLARGRRETGKRRRGGRRTEPRSRGRGGCGRIRMGTAEVHSDITANEHISDDG